MHSKFFNRGYRDEAGADGADGGAGNAGGAGGDSGAGSDTSNWYDTLPEGLRDNENITKFSGVDGLAKSYVNAVGMIGKDKIVIPTGEFDPGNAEWGEALSKLGRPDSAEGYDMSSVEVPEGMEVNEDMRSAFTAHAHSLGLNQAQVNGMAQWYWQQASASRDAMNGAVETDTADAERELRSEWGEAYDRKIAEVGRVVSEFGDEETLAYFNEAGLGRDPTILKFFSGIADRLLEKTDLDGKGGPAGQTPAEIKEEIAKIQGSDAYTNAQNPEHASAVKKMTDLFNRLHA